jgi:hypothetical protein
VIARESIAALAARLNRLRTGEQPDSEVVAWLSAVGGIAPSVPKPEACDARRGYTRTLLYTNDVFELLVLHWKPGCASAIHDHGGGHCWLTVCEGTMGIENFMRCDSGKTPGHARIEIEGSEKVSRGHVDYRSDDIHLHRCEALDGPVTTLHLYTRPIRAFHTFDQAAQTCTEVTASYDAVLNY